VGGEPLLSRDEAVEVRAECVPHRSVVVEAGKFVYSASVAYGWSARWTRRPRSTAFSSSAGISQWLSLPTISASDRWPKRCRVVNSLRTCRPVP